MPHMAFLEAPDTSEFSFLQRRIHRMDVGSIGNVNREQHVLSMLGRLEGASKRFQPVRSLSKTVLIPRHQDEIGGVSTPRDDMAEIVESVLRMKRRRDHIAMAHPLHAEWRIQQDEDITFGINLLRP